MSLLLDALKKAADDKQKASQGNSLAKESPVTSADEKIEGTLPVVSDELDIPQLKDEELTLDEVEQVSSVEEIKKEAEEKEVKELAASQPQREGHTEKKQYRVSDEALSLLINKNKS